MCIVNMVPKTPDMNCVEQFGDKFVNIVAAMSETYQEVRIVFDQYKNGSLKEVTREKRAKGSTPSIHYLVNDDTQIKNLKSFLSHIKTKAELTKYLSDRLLKYYEGKSQRILVMHHTQIEANFPLPEIVSMPEMTGGQHNLEEGDQLVLLNAFDVMHKNPESILDIFSVDTDVFVLLVGNFAKLPKSTTLIRKKGERISIQENYMKLGNRAESLIGWYAFKGTDCTGSFAGKGILSHFKAFMAADDEILDAFAKFGITQDIPDRVHNQMERFVCLLYKSGDVTPSSLRDLRWILFAQKGKEGAQLPPTQGSLIPHTARAYYMALVWKSSKIPCPQLPPPTDYHWELVEDKLKPVFCLKPPAPEALLELRKCNCKTNCVRKSCGCRKHQLPCTDLCGCGDGCQNNVRDVPEYEESDSE